MNFLDLRTWGAAFINHIAHETNLGQYHKSTTIDSVVNELKFIQINLNLWPTVRKQGRSHEIL